MAHLELAKKKTRNKRKALLVGINKYTALGEGASLSGCVNDTKDFANTLLILGFPPTRIKILTDEKATKANIVKQLEWLVKDAKPGDVLIYYHSGHGTQKADIDNDEDGDRVDEMVIPTDFKWNDSKTHLTDDDLYNFFTSKTPEGVRCEVVIDTCYSGTGTRSLHKSFPYENTNVRAVRTARFVSPPLEHRLRLNTALPGEIDRRNIGQAVLADPKAPGKSLQHNVLWPACLENQVAWEYEIDGEVRGCFTWNLCQILRRSNGNKTRRSVYAILANAMSEQGLDQKPGLEVTNPEFYDLYPFRRSIEDDPTEVPEE